MKVIVIHGERRLRNDIDRYCMACARRRDISDWCLIKNQRACKKIQRDFAGRIHGVQKNEYTCHSQIIAIPPEPTRFNQMDLV